MIRSHIKIAWRNLFKSKFFTVLNIVGLVSGIAFVLLIAAYIWQEYRVNSGLRNLDNQYVLQSEYREAGMGLSLTTVGPLAKTLKEEYPHLVADYYRIDGISCITSRGDKVFQESAALCDSSMLAMYGFELVDGDPKTAMGKPNSVVITKATAVKYFGRVNVVGETLVIQNFAGEKRDFAVTGVLKPMVRNSVINLTPTMDNTIFLPMSSTAYFGRDVDNWQNLWIAGFVELQEGVTPDQLVQPLKEVLARHADEQVAANLTPVLKPLSTYYVDDNNGAVRRMTLTLSLVAGFILLMAIINFVNISVSKSITRLREIGVRKIMGSSRTQLTAQLLAESLVVVGLSAVFALAIYPVCAPIFANVMGRELPSLSVLPVGFFGYYAMGILLLGIIAGIYPALRLSASQILQAVKGQLSGIGEKQLIRKGLLGVQFVVAMTVLISTVVISRQVAVFFSENLGYDKDYLITAQVPRDWTPEGLNRMETIRQELGALPQVENASISYDLPGAPGNSLQRVSQQGADDLDGVAMNVVVSDGYFADTYKIPMLAGHFFAPGSGNANDSQLVVLNEKAVRALGYRHAEEAVGQQVSMNNGAFVATVSGVTADFYLNTMHSAKPAVAWVNVYRGSAYRFLNIRIHPGNVAGSLAAIEEKWRELMPDAPFEYTFMDERLHTLYATEVQLQKASWMATVISIIIVVLGVVGLVSLTIQQRMKEIGIRRVLGASLGNITRLFTKDFFAVFLVALVLASAVTYYLLHQWLAGFQLKTPLNIWVFGVPIAALLGLVSTFIVLQSAHAVRTKPVDSLRDE